MSGLVTKILITAKDEASGVLTSLSNHAGKVAAVIAGAFSFISFREIISTAAEFEKAMSGVQAVTRASGEDIARLTTTAREMGASTSFSASEAAEAMQFLGMAGLNTDQIIAAIPSTLDLAKAGNLDLAAAADIASNALSGFGLQAEEMTRVADVMAATSAMSNTNVQQLGEALSYAAPIAQALGVEIETTAASIGALSDAGLQGSRAGTGLAGVLRQLTNVTAGGQGVLQRYGLTLADVDVKSRGLENVLKTLAGANLSAGDTIKLFGAEAGVAAQILINTSDRVATLTTNLQQAGGAAAEMSRIMGDNLAGDLAGLRSALEELQLTGNSLGGITDNLRLLTQSATTFARQFSEDMNLMGEGVRAAKSDMQALADDASIETWATNSVEMFAFVTDAARSAAFTIKEIFGAVGETLGAGAAQLNQVIRGNFQEANLIGQEWLADMEERKDRALAFDAELYRSAFQQIEARRAELQASKELSAVTETAIPLVRDFAAELRNLEEGANAAAKGIDTATSAAQNTTEHLTAAKDAAIDLEQAYKDLGITSPAALTKAAEKARTAFESIRDSGQASAKDIKAAFTAYAKDAIAANDGVVSAVIKAEAAQYGLKVEADETGKVIVKSMFEAAQATSDVKGAADGATASFKKMGGAAKEAAKEVKEATNEPVVNFRPSGGARSGSATARTYGYSVDAEDIAELDRQYNAIFENMHADLMQSYKKKVFVHSDEYIEDMQRLERAAVDEAMRKVQSQKNTPTASTTTSTASQPKPTATQSGLSSPSATYTVNINMGGRPRSFDMPSDAQARQLVDTLQDIAGRS